MDPDDLDDFLNGNRADLEARFRELEQEAEIERIRQESGAPPSKDGDRSAERDRSRAEQGEGGSGGDPLSEMKAALDSDAELERYLLVICPHCDAKNRMSLTKVRTMTPVCGRCKQELAFTKF
jgi:hypothetical protein